MAVNLKPASADDVRAWAREEGWVDEFDRPVADRGRMPSSLIEAFDRAHKRNRVHYVPGYKPQGQPGKELAARRDNADKAKDNTPARQRTSTPAKTEKAEPIRVPATRGEGSTSAPAKVDGGSSDGGMMALSDAIAMLQSAASTKKGGKPALITIQTLVNV